MSTIDFAQFQAVDIRAGTVLSAEPNPKARMPAYVLTIDFGPELGVKTSSAQLVDLYRPEDLVGTQVAAVVNLPAKRVAGVKSEVLVLGFPDSAGRVVLVRPERPVPNGARLF